MAKNENEKKSEKNSKKNSTRLKDHTKHGIIAIIFFVLAIFFLMSYFSIAGKAGIFIYEIFNILLGIGYVLLPALLILLGTSFLKSETPDVGWTRTISGLIFLLSSLGMIDIASGKDASGVFRHSGGLFGEILSTPFVALFDKYASLVFLGALLIISILIMFDAKLDPIPFCKKLLVIFCKKEKNIHSRFERK